MGTYLCAHGSGRVHPAGRTTHVLGMTGRGAVPGSKDAPGCWCCTSEGTYGYVPVCPWVRARAPAVEFAELL